MEAVSFTFVGHCLTTLRDVPLRSFTELQRRIVAMPQYYPCLLYTSLSTHTAMLDSLGYRDLTPKAILAHTIGGLAAAFVAHWLYEIGRAHV